MAWVGHFCPLEAHTRTRATLAGSLHPSRKGVIVLQRINAWSTRKKIIAGGIAAFALLVVIAAITDSQESTTPTAVPQVSAPEPTPVPEPTQAPTFSLDVTRDEAQKRFERHFRDYNLAFESRPFRGRPALAGSVLDNRMVVLLVGSNDSPQLFYGAVVLHSTQIPDPLASRLFAESLFLLSELAVPKWDRAKWLPEAMAALPDPNGNPGAFANRDRITETDTHGDAQINLSSALRDGQGSLTFSIGPESE